MRKRQSAAEINARIAEKLESGEMLVNECPDAEASILDLLKYNTCRKILELKLSQRATHEEFAATLGIDVFRLKEVTHCHIKKFTLDELVTFFDLLAKKYKVNKTALLKTIGSGF